MNKHRLARSLGFANWTDLLKSAVSGLELRAELRKERAGHAGLVAAAALAEDALKFLAASRAAEAAEWRDLAKTALTEADAAGALAQAYRERAGLYMARANELDDETLFHQIAERNR